MGIDYRQGHPSASGFDSVYSSDEGGEEQRRFCIAGVRGRPRSRTSFIPRPHRIILRWGSAKASQRISGLLRLNVPLIHRNSLNRVNPYPADDGGARRISF